MESTNCTRSLLFVLTAVCLCLMSIVCQARTDEDSIDIPHKKFVLGNGLTLIVHEDHKAPVVAINVWYHVGSKNEKPGRTGFAHLFEHLMFNGSENAPGEYFDYLEPLGGGPINGSTNNDRTQYIDVVPTSALDAALWMESDRMGHLLGAVTQEVLDEQRGVVQNEKREYENQPYAKASQVLTEFSYPKGHPYSWSVIGSMEDLGAATLEDVREWFRTYYGPANVVISIAGDVDTEELKAKVENYFGDIPSGPPLARHDVWIAKRTGTQRVCIEERVPQARIYMHWNVPQNGDEQVIYLGLVGDILASGKSSRLYQRLVVDEQLVTDVSAYAYGMEISGMFEIVATARPGVKIERIEQVINEELEKFFLEGPTETELRRVKVQGRAAFVRNIEMAFYKAYYLAAGEVMNGDPEAYKRSHRITSGASAADLKKAAVDWLSDGALVLEVNPFPDYKVSEEGADRSKLPPAGNPPEASFPSLQRTELGNGLKIVLAERHAVPVVHFLLLFDAGYAADLLASPGTAKMVTSMLEEGTVGRTAEQVSDELDLLGAQLMSSSTGDTTQVYLSALKENLDGSLELYADVVLNPSFPQDNFDRLLKQTLIGIGQEKAKPSTLIYRIIPGLLYGSDHPYGIPFTGSGTEESLTAMTREDLVSFHNTWFRPNLATIVVVGDTTLDEIAPKLEKLFGSWEPGEAPEKVIPFVEPREKPVIYLVDRPGSQQSLVAAAKLFPPKGNPDERAVSLAHDIISGQFAARINMNLRETKSWTYGAYSYVLDARGQRPYLLTAPVQSDKTKDTIAEIYREISEFTGDNPATAKELEKFKNMATLTLPGKWETSKAVMASIAEAVQFGYHDEYFQGYASSIRDVSLEKVREVSGQVMEINSVIFVVVGDRAKIEGDVRSLGFADVVVIDEDGNIAQP